MTATKSISLSAIAVLALSACGADKADEDAVAANEVELAKTIPDVSFKPADDGAVAGTTGKPGAPYSISYRIIGTPIIGSPLTVNLTVDSAQGPRPMTLDYRINDASSMAFADSQPQRVFMEPAANETSFQQQVTVVPQRDGRFYLNVTASFETDTGTMSTAAAIPIQVGTGTRELQENGEVGTDENGEAIRVIKED